jgi:lipid A 3-O-deacylase
MNFPKAGPASCRTGRPGTARCVCFFLLFTGLSLNAPAATDEQKGFFALTEENDAFSNPFGPHQDRHYTQGLELSYIFGDNFMTNTTDRLNHLLLWGIQPEAGNLGVVVGQNIYTPEDILDPAPIKTDRPYAGWLYAGAVYQRRGELASNLAVMENFEINLGVVGPESLAEQAQSTIHRWWFPDDVPRGWGNQLKTEPGIVLKYARLWRYSPTPGTARNFDVIPQIGGELGNVFTFATAGATGRLGYNLPHDFGEQIIDSPASVNGGFTRRTPRFSAYAFGGLDGRAVGHDITLDGNSFRSGPSVEKNVFVGDLSWGFAIQAFRHFEATYTHVTRTEEFHGQRGDDIFGSITVKLNFCF